MTRKRACFRPALHLLALAYFLFLLWIIFMADTGRQSILFDLVRSIPEGDKICHALLYGLLAVLTDAALSGRILPAGRWSIPSGIVLVASFAVIEEMSQAFFATRTCDWRDLGADAMGLTAALLVIRLLHGGKSQR